jgi:predicted LPLAT superfamily acyltransferase
VIKEAGALQGMRIMVWIYSVVGRRAFSLVLVFVMGYFFLRRGDERRASIDYLRRVKRSYPETLNARPIVWLAYCHFFEFGQSLLDKYLAWSETPSGIHMDPEESALLFAQADSGQGCLLIGSHFGNLEYSRAIAHRHPGLIINVLIYDQHAVKFASLIEESEPESRMNLIQVTDIDIETALHLRDKVRQGEWIVIAGDRVPVGESRRVCQAILFDEPANYPIGPYVLANLLGCPVYLLHCYRMHSDYHLGLEKFAEKVQLPRGQRDQACAKLAQQFSQALEKQIVKAPLQWFNFFDFWGQLTSVETDSPALPKWM